MTSQSRSKSGRVKSSTPEQLLDQARVTWDAADRAHYHSLLEVADLLVAAKAAYEARSRVRNSGPFLAMACQRLCRQETQVYEVLRLAGVDKETKKLLAKAPRLATHHEGLDRLLRLPLEYRTGAIEAFHRGGVNALDLHAADLAGKQETREKLLAYYAATKAANDAGESVLKPRKPFHSDAMAIVTHLGTKKLATCRSISRAVGLSFGKTLALLDVLIAAGVVMPQGGWVVQGNRRDLTTPQEEEIKKGVLDRGYSVAPGIDLNNLPSLPEGLPKESDPPIAVTLNDLPASLKLKGGSYRVSIEGDELVLKRAS